VQLQILHQKEGGVFFSMKRDNISMWIKVDRRKTHRVKVSLIFLLLCPEVIPRESLAHKLHLTCRKRDFSREAHCQLYFTLDSFDQEISFQLSLECLWTAERKSRLYFFLFNLFYRETCGCVY